MPKSTSVWSLLPTTCSSAGAVTRRLTLHGGYRPSAAAHDDCASGRNRLTLDMKGRPLLRCNSSEHSLTLIQVLRPYDASGTSVVRSAGMAAYPGWPSTSSQCACKKSGTAATRLWQVQDRAATSRRLTPTPGPAQPTNWRVKCVPSGQAVARPMLRFEEIGGGPIGCTRPSRRCSKASTYRQTPSTRSNAPTRRSATPSIRLRLTILRVGVRGKSVVM